MSVEKETTFNMTGAVDVAFKKGTEPVDLSKVFKETTTIIVKGDSFQAQIVFMPLSKAVVCRLGLVIKEKVE